MSLWDRIQKPADPGPQSLSEKSKSKKPVPQPPQFASPPLTSAATQQFLNAINPQQQFAPPQQLPSAPPQSPNEKFTVYFVGAEADWSQLEPSKNEASTRLCPFQCIETTLGWMEESDTIETRCEQIDDADLVFVWLDREHIYRQVWELAYSVSLGKHIVVRWPVDFDISEIKELLPEEARPANNAVAAFNEIVRRFDVVVHTEIERTLRKELFFALGSSRCFGFTLRGQHPIVLERSGKEYRVDFAIWGESKWRLAVECDGHDFHEKTKEQAAHDKARERALMFEGWPVLRFSGSEIHNNPVACAEEIVQHCLKLKGA